MITMEQKTRSDITSSMVATCKQVDAGQRNALMKQNDSFLTWMAHKVLKDIAALMVLVCRQVGAEKNMRIDTRKARKTTIKHVY